MDEKAQGTFDLDAFVQGRGFPTDTITIFTDADAAYERARIQERLTEIAQDREALSATSAAGKAAKKEFAELEKRSDELMEAIKASALTFHMRGISPGHIKKITGDVVKEQAEAEWSEGEAEDVLNFRWMAPHIIKVVNATGDADDRVFTPERVEKLAQMLPSSEWKKLADAVSELSFKSVLFDQAVDAGFLPKS